MNDPEVQVLMLKGEQGAQGDGLSGNDLQKVAELIDSRVSDAEANIADSLNTRLANSRYVPESFANSTDLKKKYPNGKDGIFITADTGHMWIFVSGKWVDAGSYQTAGRFTVHSVDLGDDVAAAFNVNGEYVDFDVIHDQFLSITDGKLTQNEGSVLSAEIPVAEGEVYGISAHTYYDARAVTFLDADKKVVSGYPSESKDEDYSARVIVPAGASYMRVCSRRDRPLAVVKHVSLYPRNEISDAFWAKTNDDFVSVDYGKMASAGYWTFSDGNFAKNSSAACSKPIKVKAGEVYKISGYNYYNGRLWILLDSNGHVMQSFDKSDANKYTETVVIPNGACFLLVNSYQDKGTTTLERGFVNRNGVYKKMTVIGDSWTAKGTLKGAPNWTDYVCDFFKKKDINLDVDNQAVGGTGYVAGGPGTNIPFYTRTIGGVSDLYVIFGSFNDLFVNWEVGSLGDSNTSTLFGCMKAVCDKIISAKAGAKIAIIAPGPWGSINPQTYLKDKAENYVKSLKEFAEYYNIPFLDLYHGGLLRPWDKNFINAYYHGTNETDETHPNTQGHKFFAPIIANFISGLID